MGRFRRTRRFSRSDMPGNTAKRERDPSDGFVHSPAQMLRLTGHLTATVLSVKRDFDVGGFEVTRDVRKV